MSQTIGVFQFNGCNKCFYETKLLKSKMFENSFDIQQIENPKDWQEKPLEKAIITGYLLPENQETLDKITKNAKQVIGFGSCSTIGGIFGLNYQRGIQITPLKDIVENTTSVMGCLGEVESLHEIINGKEISLSKSLCEVCNRKSTCGYLDEVHRQFDIYSEDEGKCFNDFGFMCTGYITKECKERCIDFGTPCRGCKPVVERSGFRMLGMWGTLMANVEVASEPTGRGGTDKLADDNDDDITEKNPDNTGNFFRHTLADSKMPIGRKESTGNLINNVFMDRGIEELPSIAGSMGGIRSISLILDIIEALEQGLSLEISEKVINLRQQLKDLEHQLYAAIKENKIDNFLEISEKIRKIAGNMNLSNVYFGGFKVPIDTEVDFDSYKYQVFEVQEGTFKSGNVGFTLDSKGLVTDFNYGVNQQ
jgi:coenzyme F420-reducing hydrogenase gamma subunit